MFFKYILFIICFVRVLNCANILAFIPTPSYSHQVVYIPLWRELSLRGHNVTVVTSNPVKDPKLVNLTEIDMHFTYKYFNKISKLAEDAINMWTMYDIFLYLWRDITDGVLAHPPVQQLIRNENKFDVVLVEFPFPEYLSFAELHDCPKILIGSLDAFANIHRGLGNAAHPALYPEIGTPFYQPLNFKERLLSTIHALYFNYFQTYRDYPMREAMLKKYLNRTFTINELISDVDMMFLNVNPVIDGVRAVGPSTINIGGYRELASSKPLPKDLKEFLDNATEGFVYFSLGTNVKSRELARPTFTAIFETLKEIPYKVLWKYEDDDLLGKPDHIKLLKWVPQQEVLSHPNIKVFVTQGGMQSMEEGIYREVPFVVIPFFADQEHNAKKMASKGIARIVDRTPSIDKGELKDAILDVINNPRYKSSVKRLKWLATDNPMSGLEKAVWYTEYVIRHKGAKHLKNPAATLPLYQNYFLDVIGFLVVVTILLVWIVVLLVKFFSKFILKKFTNTAVTRHKKFQ